MQPLSEFEETTQATRNAPPTSLWDAFLPDRLLTKRFDAKVCSRLPYGSDDVDRLNSLPRAHTHQLCADTPYLKLEKRVKSSLHIESEISRRHFIGGSDAHVILGRAPGARPAPTFSSVEEAHAG